MRNVARWIICGTLVGGCVEQPPQRRANQGPSQQEVARVRQQWTSRTAPTPQHRLDTAFGDKVTLIGYDLSPAEIRPGTSMTVTFHWRVDASTGDGWRLYTHIDDANGPRQNHDGDGEVRRAYQPDRWQRGEFVRDQQTFEIPADWDSPVVKIHVGLWKGDERMQVTRGPKDRDGRALAITINTGVQVRVSELDVPRAAGAITVDGQLNEPAWRTAGTTGPLVNPGNGAPPGPTDARGGVRVLWDERNLYLGWEVTDDNLVETGAARDAHFWENDTTEVLIDPDGDGRNYYEIQVSPGNHSFDSQQPQPPTAGAFGNVAWNPEMRTAVVANGTLGNEADADTGYVVEIAIPWTAINAGAAHTPPQVGDSWRVNFFLMDKPKQGGMRHAAWSPPRSGNFHATDRFGRITFREAPAPVTDGAEPGAGTRPIQVQPVGANPAAGSGAPRPTTPRPATAPRSGTRGAAAGSAAPAAGAAP